MPSYSKEIVQHYKNRIAGIIIVNPSITVPEIQKQLEQSKDEPLHLDTGYIYKLRAKVLSERVTRNDRRQINERISRMQDYYGKIASQLWQIVADRGVNSKIKIGALKVLADNEAKLLNAEMDAGVFERRLGNLNLIHERRNRLVPAEIMDAVIESFNTWGFPLEPKQVTSAQPETKPDGAQ